VGGIIGFMREAKMPVLDTLKLRLSDIPLSASSQNLSLSQLPGFAFPTSALLIGAGMIVGLRVSASMLFGALLLYWIFAPHAVATGELAQPGKLLSQWSLWAGSAMMLTNGLTAFALDWKVIARSIFASGRSKNADNAPNNRQDIEVPAAWLLGGLIPLAIISIILQ